MGTGFLVEKNDSGALASAILTLLENDSLRETMGRAGRVWALQHFHFNDMVNATCNATRLWEMDSAGIEQRK
jgi:glycosyltransferase involved in cell wall biosynthesis